MLRLNIYKVIQGQACRYVCVLCHCLLLWLHFVECRWLWCWHVPDLPHTFHQWVGKAGFAFRIDIPSASPLDNSSFLGICKDCTELCCFVWGCIILACAKFSEVDPSSSWEYHTPEISTILVRIEFQISCMSLYRTDVTAVSTVSRDSVETGLDDRGIVVWFPHVTRDFILSTASRAALRPARSHTELVPGLLPVD